MVYVRLLTLRFQSEIYENFGASRTDPIPADTISAAVPPESCKFDILNTRIHHSQQFPCTALKGVFALGVLLKKNYDGSQNSLAKWVWRDLIKACSN